MKSLLTALVILASASIAKADLLCVSDLKVDIQGQEVEIKERMNDFGSIVRDSIINGVRSESNVFLQANGSNIVVEVRLTQEQAPTKAGVDHRTEMAYLIELDAATNNIVKVDFSRNQEIDYGSAISVKSEMSFQTIQKGSCDGQ
jgi:hypothetical protein